ncbi:MAG TPA: FAD-dependent oxidoreductase [Abditibacteriaceae bacterium]|nr:FAD-dependent oxidoreductase [Abditibacteriaceae bacterium]
MSEEHVLECDVLVAGGGPAGVPCALAAARNGAKVILCHDRAVLGGNASSEIRMHIVGADCSGGRGVELETEAREGGIIEEIRLELSTRNPQRSASMLDLILYEKCRAETNLTLLLETAVTAAEVENTQIKYAVAERQSTEDQFRIAAKVFVDCTGDGRLGAEAGAPFREGREGRNEFKESLAVAAADNKRLGSTLLFQARKYDRPMAFTAPPWARRFEAGDLQYRYQPVPGIEADYEYGYWWLEWGGCLDTIKDNATIRDELLAILMGVWDFVKNGGDHGADNWALEWFGFVPGKRESRRFMGQYVLHEADVMESGTFEDAIAYGGWPIDTHPPEGVDAPEQRPCTQHHVPHLYDIPLRACVSREISNLMFAGRNISATHIAFASTRVMATCAVIGQGVGTAAAFAARQEYSPSRLAGDREAMHEIQQRLLRDDAYLIGGLNADTGDLARSAHITASSEQENGPALNIISGQTRAVHGERGAPPERARMGSHRWMSHPAAGLPAWIELQWDRPIEPGEIQIIFDSGLHRVLTQSHSDSYTRRMLWGQAQPEIVRDYIISFGHAGSWQNALAVQGNYQRRVVHRFEDAGPIETLRITISATNGLPHARIVEVRVYEKVSA